MGSGNWGIEGAGDTYVAEDEEEDVEEGVDGADAALYPDCRYVSIRAIRVASGESRYLAGAGRGWRGRRGRCPGCTSRVSCVRGSYDSVRRCRFLCTVGCRAILGEERGALTGGQAGVGCYLWRRMTNASGMNDDAGRGLGTCFSTDETHRRVRGCHAHHVWSSGFGWGF